MLRGLAVGLLSATLLGAPPSGHLAYQTSEQGWILDLSGTKPVVLPNSQGIGPLLVLPHTGEAFYAAGTAGTPFRSAAPYRTARAWRLPSDGIHPVFAAGNGRSVFLAAEDGGGRYDVASDGYTPLPYTPVTSDAAGELIGYQGEKTIETNRPGTGETKVLFSIGRPKPLFDALAKAKWPEKLKDLTDSIDPDMYKDQYNWGFGPPALTPDGERIFFGVNGGTSLGAAGNTTWCLMVATIADGELLPLSKVGTFMGRLPHILQVSPDNRRLLMVTSFHNNAVENPCQAYVIDLHTQEMKELLWADRRLMAIPNLVNVTSGACWSPDGQYVAISAAYYDSEAAMRDENFELTDDRFVLTIYDAVTGAVVRSIEGAQQPAWSR